MATKQVEEIEAIRAQAEQEAAEAAQRAEQAQIKLAAVLAEQERRRQANLLAWARRVCSTFASDRQQQADLRDRANADLLAALDGADFNKALAAHWRQHEAACQIHALERRYHIARQRLPEAERQQFTAIREPGAFPFVGFAAVLTGAMGQLNQARLTAIGEQVFAEYNEINDAD